MSAQMRVIPEAEADQGFSLLKDIVEMVKNPKAIDEAYERRRKAAELTDDEVKMAEDARALIARGAEIKQGLKTQEETLLNGVRVHENSISIFNNRVQAENSRLNEWEGRLKDIADEQEKNALSLQQERTNIKDSARKIDEDQSTRSLELDSREQKIKEAEDLNKDEAARLLEWETRLRAKAQRIANEALKEA